MAAKTLLKVNGLTKKKKTPNEVIFICLMLLWPLAHFAIFWVYVNINTFYLSFMRFNTATAVYEFIGLERYGDILKSIFDPQVQDSVIINCLKNSGMVFIVENFIMLPLSLILAFFLSKKVPLHNLFRIIFFLPSIISSVIVSMSFKFMFHGDAAPVTYVLEQITGNSYDFFDGSARTMRLIFLYTVWSGLGYKMILLEGAIGRIPNELIESSKLDGVSLFRQFFQIVLPLVMPTITTLFVMNCVAVFTYYLPPLLLMNGFGIEGHTSTIAFYVFNKVTNGTAEIGAAFGLLFSLCGIPFILICKKILEKLTPDVGF